MTKPRPLMTAQEVADTLGVHVQTIYRWTREYRDAPDRSPVPFIRLGRRVAFPRAKVLALVDGEEAA